MERKLDLMLCGPITFMQAHIPGGVCISAGEDETVAAVKTFQICVVLSVFAVFWCLKWFIHKNYKPHPFLKLHPPVLTHCLPEHSLSLSAFSGAFLPLVAKNSFNEV